jgi:hypothetical protein
VQPSHLIYTLAAKSEGEVLAHCITRSEFLRHVIADPRTRNTFSFWGNHFGIDPAVERVVPLLDRLAEQVGVARRSQLTDRSTGGSRDACS